MTYLGFPTADGRTYPRPLIDDSDRDAKPPDRILEELAQLSEDDDLHGALDDALAGEAEARERLERIQEIAAELVRNGGDLNWQTKRVTVKLTDLLALADALGVKIGGD